MKRTQALLTTAVHGARWGLPWVSVLAVSASLAYVTTVAMAPAGGPSATGAVAQAPADALVYAVPGWSETTPTAIDRVDRDAACDTSGGRLLYVGLNTWIPAEPKLAPCPDGAP
jgi:hypothetical protein